ncbi:MAG: DUF3667 domain-containing protein [Cytophagales bacterium]|nr:DUF3667 domain-containing protein [Cytophagales bacterium]
MSFPSSCKNCSGPVEGNYCSACGQPVLGRFTLLYLWQLLYQDLLDLDKGLWHTAKDLTLRPGRMIADYLNGKTKPYYSPLKYLLILVAVMYLINWFTTYNERSAMGYSGSDWQQKFLLNAHNAFSGDSFSDFWQLLGVLLARNLTLYFLLLLPFIAFVSKFLIKKYNYTELLIVWAYMWGHVILLMILLVPFFILFTPEANSSFLIAMAGSLLIVIGYFTITLKQIGKFNWPVALFKTLAALYGGLFSFYLLSFLFVQFIKLIF